MSPKTWDDIVERAMRKPRDPMKLDMTASIFYQAAVAVELGLATKEQAAIALALSLGELADKQHDLVMAELNSRPLPPFFIQTDKP